MKKFKLCILLFIVFILGSCNTKDNDGLNILKYKLLDNGTYEVIGYTKLNNKKLEIPKSYEGIEVTSIRYDAFLECKKITSLKIPYTITEINYSSFQGCSNLKSIVVDENNPVYDSREDCNAIINTTNNELILGCQNTIIPESVKGIGNSAFYGCSKLKKIKIPESVELIDYYAFQGCSSLKSITIPKNVNNICKNVFSDCSSLKRIKVDENNPVYDSREGCNAIIESKSNKLIVGCKNTIIPDSVMSIGSYAFYGCSKLISIYIPQGVSEIGEEIFNGCISLESIKVDKYNVYYDSRDNCNAIIITGTNTLKVGCKNTIIPNDIKRISEYAFVGCSGLKKIRFPKRVEEIGYRAFSGCSGLESISISSSVESISFGAFENCTSLKSITIPSSVKNMDGSAFMGCVNLKSIEVDKNNKVYYSREDCNAIIHTKENILVMGCKNTVIPEGITAIGTNAFNGCAKLKSITLPDGLRHIDDFAFYGCSGLKSIIIPISVTRIDVCSFDNCSNLESIVFRFDGKTLTKFNNFFECYKLKYIYIIKDLSVLGENLETKIKSFEELLKYYDLNAKIYYYSETKPLEDGNYWHYGKDGKTPVIW